MDLTIVSYLLETGDEQINDLPIFLVTLDSSTMHTSSSALKDRVWNCLSISCQLRMEFIGNVVYQVNVAPVKELGNSLSLQ